ncbi:spore germination protein KC [Cytobacillus eiseniae]|uniref:Spore germination protein KC n=1 Tax=Cytobacillus eiseniae TaxID=762947 RepID=A0ABS4RDJ3_9BACI|nr:spore germination protein KC [Cytobacillus eiseniae]
MKINKKTALLSIAFFILIGLTGCWSAHELSELAIATGLGIDKTEDGYRISVQFVNPGEIAAKKASSGVPISVHTAEGRSMLEAVRKLTTTAPRRVYLAHVRVIIFGEELAKEGLRKPLDFLSRDHEMRADFVIAIAKGLKAEDVIKVIAPMEKVSANKIFTSIETSEKNWAPTKIVLLDELIESLVSDGKEPVITGVYLTGNSELGGNIKNIQQVNTPTKIKSDYLAVFKGDKLIDWLDESESKGFNYITDNITSTVGFIECEGGGTLTIETIRSKTKLEGAIENEKPKIKIYVTAESNIGDVECPIDLSKSKTIKDIEKKFNEKTKDIIMSSVEKAKELGTDIYGFGEAINRSEPKKWEDLKKKWDEEFKNTEVVVKVDLKIRRVGTIAESFQEEEDQ